MALVTQVCECIDEARRNNYDKITAIVIRLTTQGVRFQGQRVMFTYKDVQGMFKRQGMDEAEFEECMQEVDHSQSRR